MTADELDIYRQATWHVDADHGVVREFARQAVGDARDEVEQAVRLFYAVRDGVRYSAYGIDFRPEAFRASDVLERRFGWCVTKSCLLAAAARAVGLPCRLGYADVRNHIATKKLLAAIGTDIFYYHGYNEFWLEGRWVKATVAFNRELCEKARLQPLDWDGRTDSLYHPFDLTGRRHMEYLRDHGTFADVPYEQIMATFREKYPVWSAQDAAPPASFEDEVAQESAARDKAAREETS